MLSRANLNAATIGKYSEMVVTAAFIAEGYEIGLPYGNQSTWDLLVRRNGEGWLSVQIKTVPTLIGGASPFVHCRHRGRRQLPYESSDVDLIVAFHPETGTMWMLRPVDFIGRVRVILSDTSVWRGSVSRSMITPDGVAPLNVIKHPRGAAGRSANLELVRARQAGERTWLRPTAQPSWLSDRGWNMVNRWCDGVGYKALGKANGISPIRVREIVMTALRRLRATA